MTTNEPVAPAASQASQPPGRGGAKAISNSEVETFLRGLRQGYPVQEAARAAGRPRQSFYALRRRDPAFGVAWEDAAKVVLLREEQFLQNVRETGSIWASASDADLSLGHVNRRLRSDESFRSRVRDARGPFLSKLHSKAVELALEGDAGMLRFLLATCFPDFYRTK